MKELPSLTYSEANAAPPCPVFVDAGPDVDVCEGYFQLSGAVGGNALGWFWSPETGLINPDVLNPVTYIDDSVTYTLTVVAEIPGSPNILINGDFEQGNVGFYTPYTYMPDIPGFQNELYLPGTYTVIDSPNLVNDTWPHCIDHTGGSGSNMFLVNGDDPIDTIWCQTVPVIPNTHYLFNGWVMMVHPAWPPDLYVYVNGEYINSWAVPQSIVCQWQVFAPGIWGSGNSTTAEICIINETPYLGIGDFALDDLSFEGLCAVSDSVNINLIDDPAPVPNIMGTPSVCSGAVETYTATFPPGTNITSYQWSLASGGTIISGQGTDQINILWGNATAANICLAIETFCYSNSACLNVEINTVPTATVLSGPLYYCPGEIGTLSGPIYDSIDDYQWIIPSGLNVLSGQGTNSIVIEWGNSLEEEICLEMTNECGTTSNCVFLSLSPGYSTYLDTVLCAGNIITINGTTYGNGVLTGSELFTAINGCDSLVTIVITEMNAVEFMQNEFICSGDSIFLQGAFQTQPGIYKDTFTTVDGCDSLLVTALTIVPLDTTWINSTTCDPTLAGIDTITINFPDCDSIVIHETVLSVSDTTMVKYFSCSLLDTGQTMEHLINTSGCDSIIVISTHFISPDTSHSYQFSCDSSDVGVFEQTYTNVFGCDSVVINTVSFSLSDTTEINYFTCTVADSGMTSILLLNSFGCDSFVLINRMYVGSDTTYLSGSTCNPMDSGVVITQLFNQYNCDSIVISSTVFFDSDTTYVFKSSCEPQDTGIAVQLLVNEGGCDSLVVTTTSLDAVEDCELMAGFSIAQALCYRDTAWLMTDIQVGKGPFTLSITLDDITGVAQYLSTGLYFFSLDPNFQGGNLDVQLVSGNGIILFESLFVDLPVPVDIESEIVSDYNGYGVRCYGDSNGEAFVNILNAGSPPLLVQWSNGNITPNISNLAPGIYEVIGTDMRGCKDSSSVIVTEPPVLNYESQLRDISCYGQQDGEIILSELEGGVAPWLVSLNGNSFQSDLVFYDLLPAVYHVVIQDLNGCTTEESFTLLEPEYWFLDLGSDTTFTVEANYSLSPVVHGMPQGILEWKWSDQQFENVASRIVEVKSDVTYGVTATDENGCSGYDEIELKLSADHEFFVPNIFSPNGDKINDWFLITSGSGVKEIEELTIYDRWGNQVFSKSHFLPEDVSSAWDGRINNKDLNAGVFTYKLIVLFNDGRYDLVQGDITLIR